MFIVWNTLQDRPYSKAKFGHFTVYQTRVAAQRYINYNYLKSVCKVVEVSHIALAEGGTL